MSDDYAIPYQRRTKNDLRKKRKNRVYKRGGAFRGITFTPQSNESEPQQKGKKKK